MNYLKNIKWEIVLYSIISIALGIFMWAYPAKVLKVVCITLAVILFIMALKYFMEFVKKDMYNDYYRYRLVWGVFLLLAGAFVLTRMDLILSTITYIIAIIIIFNGVLKIENALDLKRMREHWLPLMIFAIICILLGISILSMPLNHNDDGTKTAGDFMIQCAGIIFAITGLIDLITTIMVSGKIKVWMKETRAEKYDKDKEEFIDVEYEEINDEK